jgi:predicted DNA-binding transcriptional regulator YafY
MNNLVKSLDPEGVDYDGVAERKVLRIFVLISLLKQKPGYSVDKLAGYLQCNKRTVYRYFKLLEQLNYDVDSTDGYHYLVEAVDGPRLSFSKKELELLNLRLVDLGESNPLVASIRLKLKLTSAHVPLPHELRTLSQSTFIEWLQIAIASRKRVRLLRYNTTTETGEVGDRVVEPQSLTDNLSQLVARETEHGKIRTFNLSRMQGVDILEDQPCLFPHLELTPDLFGMADADKEPQAITLHLTERSYKLLIREFPAAYPFCQALQNPGRAVEAGTARPTWSHEFRCEARGYEGIGRFVMGLPTEVKVVDPEDFRAFVQAKSAGATWSVSPRQGQ